MKKSALLIMLIALGCDSEKSLPPIEYDGTALLANSADSVILQTYIDLDNKLGLFVTSVTTLKNNPTLQNLSNARLAWIAARAPWEMSEGFLFGPVDTKGIDPNIDSWPVNVVDLDAVLASGVALNETYIHGLEGTLKGFHTSEYLLWGANSTKGIGDFTARQFDYLIACAQSLKSESSDLRQSWSPTGEDFSSEIKGAGQSTSIYISQKSAIEELVDGMIGIADEVANGKIHDPFSQTDLTLEESRFSANSKADFQDNIRSIRNIYLGFYSGTNSGNGVGVSHFITSFHPDLHTRFLSEINSAITLIGNIDGPSGTFSHGVLTDRASVQSAQIAVRTIQQTLEEDIQPLVGRIQ